MIAQLKRLQTERYLFGNSLQVTYTPCKAIKFMLWMYECVHICMCVICIAINTPGIFIFLFNYQYLQSVLKSLKRTTCLSLYYKIRLVIFNFFVDKITKNVHDFAKTYTKLFLSYVIKVSLLMTMNYIFKLIAVDK